MSRPPRAPRSRRGVLLVPATLLALAAGCELIVPGSLSEVHCTEEGAIGEPACPDGMFCQAGLCRDGPAALGEACGDDVTCAPGDRCVDPAIVGLGGGSFCTRTCCSSADCGVGTGLVCGVVGPGKMCVPAVLWGRPRPGSRFGGEACDRGTDCRSGECSGHGGYCVDACCSDVECAVFGATCREGGKGWTCEPGAAAPSAFLKICEHDFDCASGACVKWNDGKARCAEPCCSSEECGKVKVLDAVKSVLCVPVRHGTAVVYGCAAIAEGDANRVVGAPCEDAGQCRGGLCVDAAPPAIEPGTGTSQGASRVCSDVCCTDASCGAPQLFACVPAGTGADPGAPPGTGGQGFDLQCSRR